MNKINLKKRKIRTYLKCIDVLNNKRIVKKCVLQIVDKIESIS